MFRICRSLQKPVELIRNTWQMTRLSWAAAPRIFVGQIVLQAALGIMPILTAWITKRVFDELGNVAQAGAAPYLVQDLLPLMTVQITINVFSSICDQLTGFLNAEMTRKLYLSTHSTLFRLINNLEGLLYFENSTFHDTLQIASEGIHSGPSQSLQTLLNMLRSVITLVSFIGVLFFLSPILAVIVAATSSLHLLMHLKMGHQRAKVSYSNSPKGRKASYLGFILSSIHFVKEIRLFNLGDYFLRGFLDTTEGVQSSQRRQELREIKWQLSFSILSTIISSVCFIIVVLYALKGTITIGDVTLYLVALSHVQNSVIGLNISVVSLYESALYFTRYKDLVALPPAIFVSTTPSPLAPLEVKIELQGVSFRYTDDSPWVLRNVNLILPKGKCVALVGLNAAGKTTLVKLLTRLYDPTEGKILWDGTDIREFDIKQLREHMSVIFQDFVRYDLTVQENIGVGNISNIGSMERVAHAANIANIHEYIESLPSRYQTVLSRWLLEDGVGADLSGGQWQKIAIARMFMRDANFMILDEPTASLDAEAEYEIYYHFATLVKGRTSLLISHRFSTLRIADLIAVLEHGEISEYGTHQELLVNSRTYAKLYDMYTKQYL